MSTLMISQSDNTATDHMLLTLGRERVEQIMKPMGVAQAERSWPLLTTREMFLLKWGKDSLAVAQYTSKDVASRRAYLAAGAITQLKLAEVAFAASKPVAIDQIEWFASSSDLVRSMNWLRLKTEAGEAARARRILAVNRGLDFNATDWPYIGYKGGSEPGVLALSFLMRSAKGDWYAMAATWNNPKAPVDEAKMFGLLQRVGELVK